MRTTITLDADATAAVESIMRARGIGRSEAVNHLIGAGLARSSERTQYQHKSFDAGLLVDVSNVAEVLDMIDEWDRSWHNPLR